MTDLRKAAEMALEALEDVFDLENKDVEAINALRQALAQPDEVLAEREACAKLVEADGLARGNEGLVLIKAAGRIRARSEKPPVKSYCGGKPNYCTPVDAVNILQERVDETAKRKHDWVGLTEEEMEDLLITIPWPQVCNAIEAKLKEKNT